MWKTSRRKIMQIFWKSRYLKYFSKKLCSLFAAAACLFSGLSVLTSAENAKAADNAVPAVDTEKQESAFNTDEQLIGYGKKFNFEITVPKDEPYAANCIWVNGKVIVPEGYPKVLKAVQAAGYQTLTCDTSEYKKIDGGLSCLSLRF